MGTKADISGVLRGLGKARAKGLAAARRALTIYAEHVIGDAQELAPVDTGALKASGTVASGMRDESGRFKKGAAANSDLSVTIGFNTSYAAAVHERLDVHHPQGQAKYLETAVRNNAPKFGQFVADQVKKELSGT